MFMSGKNVAKVGSVENVLESRQNGDPRLRANRGWNESVEFQISNGFFGASHKKVTYLQE